MLKTIHCWFRWEHPSLTKRANGRIAKERIDRNDLADNLVETASAAEDPVSAMAKMVLDFPVEAEVAQRSAPNRTSGTTNGPATATDIASGAGIRGRARSL